MIKVNGIEIKSFIFPGGECQVDILNAATPLKGTTNILALLTSSDEVMKLLLVVDAIKRLQRPTNIKLEIPYFPYARQDRVCVNGQAFSLSVMCDLINNLECSSVTIYDPHSPVTEFSINNCRVRSLSECMWEAEMYDIIEFENLTLVSPDLGAAQKVCTVAATRGLRSVISCTKVRDPATGLISEIGVVGDVENKDLMVLDEICDGGRTFIELAKVLKEKGAGRLFLYVTHGIFSKGLTPLLEFYEEVFCYHALFPQPINDRLTIYRGF